MTQYLLSVYTNDEDIANMSPEDMQKVFDAVDVFNAEVKDAGPGCSPAGCTRRAPPRR